MTCDEVGRQEVSSVTLGHPHPLHRGYFSANPPNREEPVDRDHCWRPMAPFSLLNQLPGAGAVESVVTLLEADDDARARRRALIRFLPVPVKT